MFKNIQEDHTRIDSQSSSRGSNSSATNTLVSFIIIGRNEGWRLELCLKSTVSAIEKCSLNAEIIYIDSQSTDDSLAIAKKTPYVRPYVITGTCNAAIARNIGVKEAQGESLIFLDGDMEINPDFLKLVLDKEGELMHEFVSGNFMNYYYDDEGNFLRKDYYRKIYCEKDTIQYTTGGLFAIKRKHWESVGGMRNKYKKGQDLDLGFRLAKRGIPLLRKKELMAKHHTIDYKDKKRLWRSLSDGSNVYPRAVLYRDHLFNKYVIKRMLTSDPTWILLIAMIALSFILECLVPMIVYLILSVLAVMFSMRKTGFKDLLNRIVNHVVRDIYNLLALFFFYPSNNIEEKYKEV